MSNTHEPSMTVARLQHGRSPQRIGRRIEVLAETTSTNMVALEKATHAGLDGLVDLDGLVVLSDYQTAGRGRLGRSWLSPRGASILCSVLLIPGASAPEQEQAHYGGWLTLTSAVAGCEAIRKVTTVSPAIKWPNDLRVGNRKLGGILIESRLVAPGIRAWALGIGINCLQHKGHFPPELDDLATSLEIEAPHPIDRVTVTRGLLDALDDHLASSPADRSMLHAAWLHHAEPIGRRVRVLSGGHTYEGSTIAVDPSGGLIVQIDGGRQQWFDPMRTELL